MSKADIHIDRLVIQGRPLSASEAKRLARLVAIALADTPPPTDDRSVARRPRVSVKASQEEYGTASIERLARLVAREIRRSLA
jgi:hypothetical protein